VQAVTRPKTHTDVVVVGLGLIGCAATRHLASAGVDVVGVGPAEPANWAYHDGPFASHYDSGRITRRLDAREEWAILASRSIDRYAEIEEASQIRFHHPTGLIFVRDDPGGIANQKNVIRDLDLPVSVGIVGGSGGSDLVHAEYQFPTGWTVLSEPGPAGFIDPRLMAQAQIVAAEELGARIRREEVVALDSLDAGGWRIRTTSGEVEAGRVLLATGPYLQDLHRREMQACVRPESVILGRISNTEAQRLASLPAAIYLLDHPEIDDVYIVPPVRYPDGGYDIKMGGSNVAASVLTTAAEKHAWMSGESANRQLPVMKDVLTTVLPGVNFEGFEMKPCLITDTPTGLPYVDQIDNDLYVAVGGNGHAAKSADAIGALVAGLVTDSGQWTDPELDRAGFAAQFGQWSPRAGSRHGN
jgi:sarcosine oxidase